MELIRQKPEVAYLIIRNNINLILSLTDKPAGDDELNTGIYKLLLELNIEKVHEFTGEVN